MKIKRWLGILFGMLMAWYVFNSYFSLLSIYIPFLASLKVSFAFPDQAMDFLYAISDTGYLSMIIQAICVVAGLLLIVNRFRLLALLVLLPITFNIFLFTLFLAPGFIWMGIIVFGLNTMLLIMEKNKFKNLISFK